MTSIGRYFAWQTQTFRTFQILTANLRQLLKPCETFPLPFHDSSIARIEVDDFKTNLRIYRGARLAYFKIQKGRMALFGLPSQLNRREDIFFLFGCSPPKLWLPSRGQGKRSVVVLCWFPHLEEEPKRKPAQKKTGKVGKTVLS